jgi:exosortase/archaeosortase family protein
MRLPVHRRELVAIPAMAVAVAGVSALTYYAGQALAYLSLVFGLLFFAFAARYYVATISVLLAPSATSANGKNGSNGGSVGNGSNKNPKVSVHIALYNEERVVDRLLTACSKLDYPNYEVVVVDDSRDGTVKVLKEWILNQIRSGEQKIKIYHRDNRKGFKGGALNEALKHTDPKAEYVVVFDADFVPEPDIIKKFLAYFNRHGSNGNGNGDTKRRYNGKLAAVQGYQWHTLNRTENWLTRGVSCEFSGNYMVDRTFQEVTGVMKMVAGSVYMIRADVLKQYGWSGSITEDWELTLRLYEHGYKVLYTPLIQAPAECPSTLGKLIRQRMRWAEGHTYNVKKHFIPMLLSPKVGIREKLEFLYFTPYYLQSVFLILGTFSWLASDIFLGAKLPFWTANIGWALVISNLLALPIMSLTGLFLEKRARKDFRGLASQLVLTYALSPYQAFAALKGLVEPIEGSWVRTFKSGKLAGFPGKLEPRRVIKNVLPPRRISSAKVSKAPAVVVFGVSLLFVAAFAQGALNPSSSPQPAYYFYNQSAPPTYSPFPAPSGLSFLMHLVPPNGQDWTASIGGAQGSGPVFFSDTALKDVPLPFGASVSIHIWVDGGGSGTGGAGTATNPLWVTTTQTESQTQTTETQSCSELQSTIGQDHVLWHTETCTQTQTKTETSSQMSTQTHTQTTISNTNPFIGNLKFRIDFYNPANNSVTHIPGVGETQVIGLRGGVNYYQASWGNFAQDKVLPTGDTIVVSMWCPDCNSAPLLLFNSQTHPSNIDFPIEVPEDSISLVALAVVVPGLAGLVVERKMRGSADGGPDDAGRPGLRRIQETLIMAGALIFLTLPLILTFNGLLASVATATGFDRVVSAIVPYEASAVGDLLRGFGLAGGSSGGTVWLGGSFLPVAASVDWNCAGWQSFVLFGLTSVAGLGEVRTDRGRVFVLVLGAVGVLAMNVFRIFAVVLLGYYVNYSTALIFHDYGGAAMTLVFLFAFWTLVLNRQRNMEE